SSDLVLVTLSDCLTTAETKIVAAGQADLVIRARSMLYGGIRDEATAIVEELTDRQVTAYLTAQHHDPDLAILVFYLAAAPLRLA
ncbi:MAG: Na-translocating system protein MpsC family protein, partial [Propionibacteriaceae bacterium]